eukprot:NODE_91_length_21557_cov_0.766660.p8 type:complete len:355 gc:universal NODE_91_length_21557_cov_0.766660:388-1452(+)
MLSEFPKNILKDLTLPNWEVNEPRHSTPLNGYMYIDTIQALKAMIEDLKNHSEIAVDVEHYAFHSYSGDTCLIQISTRCHDYIVDALKLKNQLFGLNTIFCNKDIIKVLHDASSDIIWLQKDLGLYLVNIFDTFIACKNLDKGGQSLAKLLKFYCNIESDKSHQRADWSIRPLPKDCLIYAQCDTHFLLEIYDNLRNELIITNAIEVFFSQYKIASYKNIKPLLPYDYKSSWKSHLEKFKKSYKRKISPLSVLTFKFLHYFRDSIGRHKNLNIHRVFTNKDLFKISFYLPQDLCMLRKNISKQTLTGHIIPFLDKLLAVLHYAPTLVNVRKLKFYAEDIDMIKAILSLDEIDTE